MKVNTALLFTTTFCCYFASAHRIDSFELKESSVASPEPSQVQNLQYGNGFFEENVIFEKRADLQISGEARLNSRIIDFFEDLKSYTVMEMFRFASFAADASKLDRELTELVRHVKSLPVPDPVLLNRVQFAQIVFQDMKYASEIVKTFPQILDTNELILRNLLQLNVILFNCRDSDGSPDPLIREYGDWVHSLSIAAEEWAQEFGVGDDSPIALKLLFDRQLLRLRAELGVLKSAIATKA